MVNWLRRAIEQAGFEWHDDFETLVPQLTDIKVPTRELQRRVSRTLRAAGIRLYMDAYVRTQRMLALQTASWDRQRPGWEADTLVYRVPPRDACRECLRLYMLPDGMPRLYRVGEVEQPGARRANRGPRRKWVQKIGPVHDNCRCSGWMRWIPLMEQIWSRTAPQMAEMMRRVGVY